MRYLKQPFYKLVALFIIPVLIFYPAVEVSAVPIQNNAVPSNTKTSQQQIIGGFSFSYDGILALIESLENGELERRCTTEELWRINQFVALLAKKGTLPSESIEESILDNDIQKLLYGGDTFCEYLFSYDRDGDCFITPGVHSGMGEIILCKSWIHKKWDQGKKFVKKHKTAILIGAVVAVAAVVVVCTVGLASTAATAGAAAGAAALSGSDEKEKNQPQITDDCISTPSPIDPSYALVAVNEAPILKEVLEEHISIFKEALEDDTLLETSTDDPSFGENVRTLGAVLAHQTLDGISELASCVPQLFEEIKDIGEQILPEKLLCPNHDLVVSSPVKDYGELIAAGHEKIDELFSTDQAGLYTPEAKEANSKFSIGILPPPGFLGEISANIGELLEAGKVLDRAGLTRAGRGLMKHGYRQGSVFPKPTGNVEQINKHGQMILEEILSDPNKKVYQLQDGSVKIYSGDGRGAFFKKDGSFRGFIEQQYE